MYGSIAKNITGCMRCGTCCMKGGPILHHKDKEILLSQRVGHQHLVTIRKGEQAFNPVSGRIEPVPGEIIKVIGKGEEWTCYFYDEKETSCKIYEHRFLECRLLKCWDTSEVMSVIGKNTIVRSDIINPDDPIMSVIETHEQECPYQEFENLISLLNQRGDKSEIHARLTALVRRDISMRTYATSELGLKPEFELFILGRPLSNFLSKRGLTVRFPDDAVTHHSKKRTE